MMHYFCSSPILLLCVSYAVCALFTDSKLKWPTPEQEALDEINDAQILKAVQTSMREWAIKSHKHQRKKRATKKVCYGDLGCFEDSGPFSYLEMLPSSPEEINTKFYFYSTKNRSDGPLLELPFLNLTTAMKSLSITNNGNTSSEDLSTKAPISTTTTEKTKHFIKSTFTLDDLHGFNELSTRVIVHGFGSACPHVWIYEMKTALMAVENCIVICVDWENGATFPNYVRAAANTRLVGKQLAMLLQNLQKYKGLNLAKTHIIGFSLGAHVAGFAGAELPGLNRITGLDPAGPLFESQHPTVRLDNTDAKFVDVIHSNGENLILGGLGSWQPMGHVDFYPNGGRVQTGCSHIFVGAVTDFIWSPAAEVEGRSLCNHRRAYKFFIDSVAPRCLFPAFPCDSYENFLKGKCFPCKQEDIDGNGGFKENGSTNNSRCGNMGYYADKSTGRGQLYLVTRDEEPFCAHQFQIEVHNSFNELPLRTIGKLEATLEGEGGLNETFLITDKEDAEFFAGDVVSRIIVPHPALGFPTSLTLQYKSYSGWLTKGLPHWDIDKVVLTDSFGRSHSLCQPSLSLSSGTPKYMALQPGICKVPEPEEEITVTPSTSVVYDDEITHSGQDRLDEEDGIESVKHKKHIYNLGTSYKFGKNQSYALKNAHDSYGLEWQPVLEGSNSLDKDVGETSRSLNADVSEIFEPVLKDRNQAKHKGRNLHDFGKKEEIVEPVLKSTTPKVRKVKEIPTSQLDEEKAKNQNKSSGLLTVQLFPFRLGELLERAERYARETLLPLISEHTPRFFNFGSDKKDSSTSSSERKPRYIPRFDNEAKTKQKISDEPKDLITSETQQYKNILELVRDPNKKRLPITNDRFGVTGVIYYSNKEGNNAWDFSESEGLSSKSIESSTLSEEELALKDGIRIDLPTYHPPVKNFKNQTKLLSLLSASSSPSTNKPVFSSSGKVV